MNVIGVIINMTEFKKTTIHLGKCKVSIKKIEVDKE